MTYDEAVQAIVSRADFSHDAEIDARIILDVIGFRQMQEELQAHRQRHIGAEEQFAALERCRREKRQMQERLEELERRLHDATTGTVVVQRDAARALAEQLAEALKLHAPVRTALAAYEARDWK